MGYGLDDRFLYLAVIDEGIRIDQNDSTLAKTGRIDLECFGYSLLVVALTLDGDSGSTYLGIVLVLDSVVFTFD